MNRIAKLNESTTQVGSLQVTRALLACGIIAGPLYLVAGLVQAFTRPGFDITRHSLSLLSNGDLGWIHITNLVATGLLVMAGAGGMHRAMFAGRGRTWGPSLVGIYGLSLVGAGIFVADPAYGFPPGTPADASAMSWHGLLHFVIGGIGFLALIAACLIFARRFAALRQTGWAAFSILTALIFLTAFLGVASNPGQSWAILGFWIGVTLAWAWISTVAWRLRAELAAPQG